MVIAAAVAAVAATAATDRRLVRPALAPGSSDIGMRIAPRVARRNSGFFVRTETPAASPITQNPSRDEFGWVAIMPTHKTDTPPTSSRQELLAKIEQVLDEPCDRTCEPTAGTSCSWGSTQDKIVQVRMTGACQGCASAIVTLTMGVESTLKAALPEDSIHRGRAMIGDGEPAGVDPRWQWPRAAYVHIPFCATSAAIATSPRWPGSITWPIAI